MKDTYDEAGKFTTIEEQIKKIENYGIEIDDKEYAGAMLKRNTYFYLFDIYSGIFKINNERRTFLPGTTFKQIYHAYEFDVALKLLVTEFLKQIERHIKTLVAYYFTKLYSHRFDEYLSKGKYSEHADEIIDMLNRLITDRSRLAKYEDINDNVPMLGYH